MPRLSDIIEIRPLSVRLIDEWRRVLSNHGFKECSYPEEYIGDGVLHGSVYFRNRHNFVIAVTAQGHRGSRAQEARSVSFIVLYGSARCRFDARDNFTNEVKRVKEVLRVLEQPEMLPTYIGDEEMIPIINSWCRGQNG